MFFNTTNETGDRLKALKEITSQQEQEVYRFFMDKPHEAYTPFDVWQIIFDDHTPITSVRRAITNLTNKGLLQKTNTKRIGEYGRLNHCWRLFKGQMKLFGG